MERVFAVPADKVAQLVPMGLVKMDESRLLDFAQREGDFYDRTPQLEENKELKQIIVYFMVKHGTQILMYQRAKKSLDKRTHGKHSIGFGGHVNLEDSQYGVHPVAHGLQRELEEELKLPLPARFTFLGALNILRSPIDQFHLGFVYEAQVASPEYMINEPENFAWSGWSTPADVAAKFDQLEGWSQEVFSAFYPQLIPANA